MKSHSLICRSIRHIYIHIKALCVADSRRRITSSPQLFVGLRVFSGHEGQALNLAGADRFHANPSKKPLRALQRCPALRCDVFKSDNEHWNAGQNHCSAEYASKHIAWEGLIEPHRLHLIVFQISNLKIKIKKKDVLLISKRYLLSAVNTLRVTQKNQKTKSFSFLFLLLNLKFGTLKQIFKNTQSQNQSAQFCVATSSSAESLYSYLYIALYLI